MYCPPQAGSFGIFDFIARCARRIQRPGVFCVSDRINAVFFSVALAARNISERRNRSFNFITDFIRRDECGCLWKYSVSAVRNAAVEAARNISERRNRIFGFLFYIIRRSKNIFLIFSHNHLTGLDLNDIIVNCIIIA